MGWFKRKNSYDGAAQYTDPNKPGYLNPHSDGTRRPANWCPDGQCTPSRTTFTAGGRNELDVARERAGGWEYGHTETSQREYENLARARRAQEQKEEAEYYAEIERKAAQYIQEQKEKHAAAVEAKVNRWMKAAQEQAKEPEPVKVNKWKSL